jgi:hypothetical protein
MGHRKVTFRHADALSSMPWDEFERLMARHYAARGYRVDHSGTGARTSSRKFDGGIDLKLFRDDEYIVVQCKRETVLQVTHNVVHELIGVMHTQGATRAIVVNTGEFSAAAIEAAAKFPQIELIDGVVLRRMLAATGDLPTGFGADDVLSSMAGARKNTRVLRLLTASMVIGILVFGVYVAIPAVFRNMTTSLVHATRPTSMPRPPSTTQRAPPFAPTYPRAASIGPSSSSTTPPPAALTKLSKKEAEEWDRKNAESMRILEKTTPTLPQ